MWWDTPVITGVGGRWEIQCLSQLYRRPACDTGKPVRKKRKARQRGHESPPSRAQGPSGWRQSSTVEKTRQAARTTAWPSGVQCCVLFYLCWERECTQGLRMLDTSTTPEPSSAQSQSSERLSLPDGKMETRPAAWWRYAGSNSRADKGNAQLVVLIHREAWAFGADTGRSRTLRAKLGVCASCVYRLLFAELKGINSG